MIKIYNILGNYGNKVEKGLVLEEKKIAAKDTALSEVYSRIKNCEDQSWGMGIWRHFFKTEEREYYGF